MPIYQGNKEILTEYLGFAGLSGNTALGNIYLGTTKVQPGDETYISATGGSITYSGNYKIHTFTTVGTSSFNISSLANTTLNNTIEYLIVAGGGAGGIQTNGQGPGGGAGGFLTGSLIVTSSNSNQVIVGVGGSGTNASANPSSGSNSSIFNILAYGGGCFGNSINFSGQGNPNGGSGAGQGGSGTAGQGFDGGTLYVPGGGGAGQAGQNGTNSPPLFAGNGGSGSLSSITGTPTYYAGGGAGGGVAGDANNKTPGTGGIGGGGDGGNYTGTTADRSGKNATYYGGAGGGVGDIRSFTEAVSGNGYQGIIIVRYPYK